METRHVGNQQVTFHRYHTIIVGSGAAGMNCAVHLYEFLKLKGVAAPQDGIAIVTRGLGLGASRMSGSDKQTYYKQAAVAFPTDALGTFIGYKTDHDPAERATSAGPKTSRFMSECLQREAHAYGIPIFDQQEAAHLLTVGSGSSKRVAGLLAVDRSKTGP